MPSKSFHHTLDENLHILITRGNHEAFVELKKRYHRHALILCNELLNQYLNTGITKKELMAVCDDHFPMVIAKYASGMSSFYLFWKESSLQSAMDYLVDNSYGGNAASFNGSISLNQDTNTRYNFEEILAEKEISWQYKRKLFEIKAIIERHKTSFTTSEIAILNCTINGYTIKDLEATGLYSKSHLYLTFNSAITKLSEFAKTDFKNRK